MAESAEALAGVELTKLLPIALGLLANDTGEYASLKQDLRRWATDDPVDALMATVLGGGLAFYLAERDVNPNCVKPWDGILYIATCLSVGYDNVFPMTPAGHALAVAVQTFGPALAGMAFDTPASELRAQAEAEAAARAAETAQSLAMQQAILGKLEDIVKLLSAPR
ncbi:MAG TPA: ion channel [Kofleriaceae bacterium]